jgi:hypothetical protein
MTPDTIKCQERIRHLLHAATTDKLNKVESAPTVLTTVTQNLTTAFSKCGLLPLRSATSNLHKITRPDTIMAASPHEVIAIVHSRFDKELTRATPPELPIPLWEHPDNPEPFVIESRGDPSLTLAGIITRDTFDKTVNSLGTCKAPGPYGIPNEIIKFLPKATRSALFSPLSLLAHKAYTPPECCHNTTCLLHKKGDLTLMYCKLYSYGHDNATTWAIVHVAFTTDIAILPSTPCVWSRYVRHELRQRGSA